MRKSFSLVLFVLLVGAAGSGCVATGSAHGSASASMPSMVYIGPEVQVIEDYDEPIFYSSSFYWHFDGGVWYQSHSYTGGWVRVATPPPAIVSIQQPSVYVHYRASANANGQANAAAAHQEQAEHHEAQEERHDEKREEHAQDKQEKAQDKQEKHEDKQEKHEDKKDHKK